MKKDIVLVDCFNTIILRKSSPDDVLFLWGKEMHGIFPKVSAIDFYELFKNAELEIARFKKVLTAEREYTIYDIFAEILAKIKFYNLLDSQQLQKFESIALDKYSKVEMESHYANQKIVNFLIKQKQNGSKIYVLSDFYCPKEILITWLEKICPNGLIDDVFVSCEHLASKRTGALYKKILENLNVQSKQVLMIGDNLWSDNRMAKKHGIKTKWIFKPYKKKSRELKSYKHKLFIPDVYKQIFKEYGKKYNYSNYAFPLYVYIKRLVRALERNGAKDIFFMAREGYFLKQLFDHFVVENNININSHYLEVSRGSIMSASLKPLDQEDFSFVLKTARMIKPNSFLHSFNFTDEEIAEIFADVKINPKKLYKNFANSKEFLALKNSSVFQKHYENMRQNAISGFKRYLESFDVDIKSNGMHVVDVGWKGTIQNILKSFFDNQNVNISICGYYVGYFKTICEQNNKKLGLMYSKILSPVWAQSRVQRYRMRDYEQILRAPKNRTIGYKPEKPYVVYDKKIDETEVHKRIIEPLQNQIFEKFKKICQVDKTTYSNIDSIAVNLYYKLIRKISLSDYKFMNACQNSHYDSFGYMGYTLKFDLKFFKWGYFRFMDMLFLLCNVMVVHKKRIFWN